jgi:hypothetical protein
MEKAEPFENGFRQEWDRVQSDQDFKHHFQYLEYQSVDFINHSPTALLALSVYFVASPMLCLGTPIVMMLIPFLLLSRDVMTWSVYCKHVKLVFSQHAVYKLFANFASSGTSERLYLLITAFMFFVQVYANCYGFIKFRRNISKMRSLLTSMKEYVGRVLANMGHATSCALPTYAPFLDSVDNHMIVLTNIHDSLTTMNMDSFTACGKIRALFYELHCNPEFKSSVAYAFQFNKYLDTLHHVRRRLGKQLQACTFKKNGPPTFERAYYPFAHEVKNTYEASSQIITGPNASGKTTMLKTTMINIILSQQLGCGHYKRAELCPYELVCSYINIPDTSGRDSLFQAEARRCKDILKEANTGTRMFCIFDELFSGTNPEEACASSVALLSTFMTIPTFTFMLTTHFFPVCEALKADIPMRHMKCKGETYTYKIGPGISYVKGGLRVLKDFKIL